MDSLVTELLQHDKREKIEVKSNCLYKIFMEHYLADRSALFNEGSTFSCPNTCERMGCKESNLHISISLADLVALSLVSGQRATELFKRDVKIGFDPVH